VSTFERDQLDDVIGSIYENLIFDEPWRDALEKTRVLFQASNMMLRISAKGAKPRDSIFAYGPKVDQTKVQDWEDHIYREIFPVSPAVGEVMFFQWEDVLQQGDVLEYMRSYDSSWTIVHCFDDANKTECLLIGSRERDQRPFTSFDGATLKTIGGHFRNAVRLRREYLQVRLTSDFQGDGLTRMRIGGVLADQNGSMILLNDVARRVVQTEDCLRFHNDKIHAVDQREDRKLQEVIAEVLASDERNPLTRAFTVSRRSGKRNLGLVISGRRSISLASGAPELNALIFIRDVESAIDLDINMMQQLFAFTRAESRLAVGLAKGLRLDEVESELNIRHNTARAHLRSMFLKAGVNRQSELVHLLANCVAPLGSDEARH
jgi:DNA-binding CsgD family transcriptional regulator